MDESTLVRHAANGDAAAWEPLVLAHQEAVFRLSYLLLGDPDDADDVAQETFLRAWNYLKRFDPAPAPPVAVEHRLRTWRATAAVLQDGILRR